MNARLSPSAPRARLLAAAAFVVISLILVVAGYMYYRGEILADARYRAGIFSLILGLIMLLSAATVALFYRQRHRGIARDLIRAERLRVESEETYHLLFEHMSEGCAYCQMLFEDGQARDWIYISVNEAFGKLTGLKDVVGKLVSEVIPGIRENDPELFEFYARVTRSGKPEKIETFVHALQQWYSVSVYSPQKDYFVAVFDVITERKREEEAMLRSRNMLAHILNSVPQAVFWKDRNSVYLGCNMVYARVAGLASPEEIVGKTDFDFGWARQDAEGYIADDREVMEGNRAKFHIEETVRDESGARLWYDTSKLPLVDSKGRVYGVLGVYEDITWHKRVEEELQNLRTAVEQSANTIVITDARGNIEYVNPAFEKATGYSSAEAVGQNPRLLKSGEQSVAYYCDLWETIAAGRIWRGEFRNRRKDGSLFWESATISPVHNDRGDIVHFIAVKEDITVRKSLESNLLDALDRAEAGNRAKSEFLAVVSHELRTPLNGVLGFAELLSGTPLSDEQSEYARTIRNSGDHLLQLVNDILDFSSIEKGNMKFDSAPFEMAALLESSCLLIRKQAADKGIEFRCETAAGVPQRINGDERRICQILLNLLGNAVKFTSSGSVALRIAPASDGGCPCLDFSVRDTGHGLSPETIPLLFKPFMQADSTLSRPFQGTGLGLAISQRLAEAMGGRITVISAPGQGSTFTFRLPVGDGGPGVPPVPAQKVSTGGSPIQAGAMTGPRSPSGLHQ